MKLNKILAGACAALMLTAACGSEKSNDNKDAIEFECYSFDVLAQYPDSLISPEEGGKYCRVTGNGVLPVRINDCDIVALRDTLCKMARVIMLSRNNAQPYLEDGLSIISQNSDSVNACSIETNTLAVDLVTPRLVVWKNFGFSYPCGAAHGIYATTFLNYSIQKGCILSLNDIFRPGYEEDLVEVLRRKLEAEDLTLLVSPSEIGVPADFRITTDGIEFVYGLYEIAPYSEGEVKVEIARYEIEDLFAPGAEDMLFGDSTD